MIVNQNTPYRYVCQKCGEYFIEKPKLHFATILTGWKYQQIKCHGELETINLLR